ncbi:unnamed protein product [Prorocentrum cordatum]|uniref:Uncharacterized protein n=1 Tax=Prorocentrum cordatum TaxID=2364126 RepID=A0ABN9YFF4_9DINO|nr:unnamed protein product [Polarella glacialis]
MPDRNPDMPCHDLFNVRSREILTLSQGNCFIPTSFFVGPGAWRGPLEAETGSTNRPPCSFATRACLGMASCCEGIVDLRVFCCSAPIVCTDVCAGAQAPTMQCLVCRQAATQSSPASLHEAMTPLSG